MSLDIGRLYLYHGHELNIRFVFNENVIEICITNLFYLQNWKNNAGGIRLKKYRIVLIALKAVVVFVAFEFEGQFAQSWQYGKSPETRFIHIQCEFGKRTLDTCNLKSSIATSISFSDC